jgi:hypothetical protein
MNIKRNARKLKSNPVIKGFGEDRKSEMKEKRNEEDLPSREGEARFG